MEVYLIRHTTPDIAPRICYGQSDIGLAAIFEEEKAKVMAQLPEHIDALYTSPLQRCHILATSIPAARIHTDARLMEVNFGTWEMQSWDTIPRVQLQPWMEDFVNVCPPGGESMLQIQQRVTAFWQELLRTPAPTVAIVTHAGVIRLLMAHLRTSSPVFSV